MVVAYSWPSHLFLSFYFHTFGRAIIIGIIMDTIYGSAQIGVIGFIKTWIFTFGLLAVFIVTRRIKKQLFI